VFKLHHANPLRLLSSSIANCVYWWWRGDRIRASPREGQLLSLTPGSPVEIAGTLLEIRERVVCDTALGPIVQYHCYGANGEHLLSIAVDSSVPIRWEHGGNLRELCADEIEVWRLKSDPRWR
jgi:hypothetical protein